MTEPTLAEMVRDWRDVEYWEYDVSGEKVASICANEITAFHARAKALAEKWERIEHAFDGKHGWTVKKKLDPVKLLQEARAELLALLGDLQP